MLILHVRGAVQKILLSLIACNTNCNAIIFEIANWKVQIENCKLEIANWKLESANCKLEIANWKFYFFNFHFAIIAHVLWKIGWRQGKKDKIKNYLKDLRVSASLWFENATCASPARSFLITFSRVCKEPLHFYCGV